MCVVTQKFSLRTVTLSMKTPNQDYEGGLGDVVDNSGDIAGALVTRIPGSRWWRDDTSSAGDSSDCSGN